MKRLLRGVSGVLAALALAVGGSFLLVETGEVVVLHNSDPSGQVFRTRLWVVDHEGSPWVSTGNPSTRPWFARVRAQPKVELVRGVEVSCRDAVVVDNPLTRREVRRLFREKYWIQTYGSAFLNRFVAPFGDPAEPVVIRLEPCKEGS